jgi:MYXO-CTERM domain-containing protein
MGVRAMTRPATNQPGPVDRALDELFDRLAGTGGAGRRALAETEDHLRAAVAEGVAAGLSDTEAQRQAVVRFGPPARISGELRATHLGSSGWLRQAFVGTWLVGGLLGVAIGVSGVMAALLGTFVGADFVSGDASGVTYTAERCAEYFEYVPTATSCAEAAAVHHFGEIEQSRIAVGVLGLFGLGVLWLVRRRTSLGHPAATPPAAMVAVVLLALFGLASALLGGLSLMELAFGQTSGVGANLSAGVASGLAALAVAAWILARRRRAA